VLTSVIKQWILSGYSSIQHRIKFGVTGQDSSPQSSTISYRRPFCMMSAHLLFHSKLIAGGDIFGTNKTMRSSERSADSNDHPFPGSEIPAIIEEEIALRGTSALQKATGVEFRDDWNF
jgi:hypothetical protein